jgi:valyl-tRNA synthetase
LPEQWQNNGDKNNMHAGLASTSPNGFKVMDKCILCKKNKQISEKIMVCRKCKKVIEPLLMKAYLNALDQMINLMTFEEALQFRIYFSRMFSKNKDFYGNTGK